LRTASSVSKVATLLGFRHENNNEEKKSGALQF
jgi:hypothetical protein